MSKITLTNLVNLQNETTAVNAINANNAALTTASDNTLSRDGTSPNTMSASLDMNSNQILNLPAPTTVNSPARLIDVVSNPTITIPSTGTSGHTVPYLDAANTWSAIQTFNNSDIALKGSSTGATTFTSANAGASNFTVTVPAATDTLVTKASTDTLTNKSIDTAGTGNHIKVSGTDLTLGQYPAIATNTAATAGNIGEYVSNTASGVAIVSGVSTNVTSISLTAGEWHVWGYAAVSNTGTTTYTFYNIGTNSVSATLPTEVMASNLSIGGAIYSWPVPFKRYLLSGTTTVYLVASATFAGGAPTFSGGIFASRVR